MFGTYIINRAKLEVGVKQNIEKEGVDFWLFDFFLINLFICSINYYYIEIIGWCMKCISVDMQQLYYM